MNPKMWGGRFKKKTNAAFEYFSSSLAEDYKLAAFDIEASKVHCRALERAGIIGKASRMRLVRAFDAIARDLAKHQGEFIERKYEDIHSFLESELLRRAGPDAKKLHAGRSRNDQVNQATRMYCKSAGGNLLRLIAEVQTAVVKQAKRHEGLVVAGTTHLQKAQPILLSHQFLSYVEALERSKERLEDSLKRVDVLTLGSGALAGTSLAIDRKWVARELGFGRISANSLDAVGSRDFVAEFVSALALLGVQLSRMAEDFLIGQIDEIGWYDIPEDLCTGSSMMPQKKNPDFLELARGAAGILVGNTVSLLVVTKGLPGSYNRDLQWDKKPLFDSVELVTQVLFLYRVFFEGLKVNAERARASAEDAALCATDVAEYLVTRGVSFREAHEKTGEWVRACAEKGLPLKAAGRGLLGRFFGKAAAGIPALLDPGASVRRKKSLGGTSPAEVRRQIREWERRL